MSDEFLGSISESFDTEMMKKSVRMTTAMYWELREQNLDHEQALEMLKILLSHARG